MARKINARDAMKIAKSTAEEAGYDIVTVSRTDYDEDENEYTIELASGDTEITVTISGTDGEVLDFKTE